MILDHLKQSNPGHAGRPGQKGGSAPGKGTQSRVKGVENKSKGIYTKEKGLASKDGKPIGEDDTTSIFNQLRIGDIVKGQKSYSDGSPNGSAFKGKVTNMGLDGSASWIEVEGSNKVERLYNHEYYTKFQFHHRVGDAVREGGSGSGNQGHAGRPGQRGGSAPKGSGTVTVLRRDGTPVEWTVDKAAYEIEGVWQNVSADIYATRGDDEITIDTYKDVVGDNLYQIFNDSPFKPSQDWQDNEKFWDDAINLAAEKHFGNDYPVSSKPSKTVKGGHAINSYKQAQIKLEKQGYVKQNTSQSMSPGTGEYVNDSLVYVHPTTKKKVTLSLSLGSTSYYNRFTMQEE